MGYPGGPESTGSSNGVTVTTAVGKLPNQLKVTVAINTKNPWGAIVNYNDPHVPRLPPMHRYPHLDRESRALTAEYLQGEDCVVIVTDHSAYDWHDILCHAPLVIDTRNATRDVTNHRERIVRA